MLRLLPLVVVFTVPDAGFSWPAVREQLMRCDLDAGRWVARVGECTITCTPDDLDALLPDGGWCQSGAKIPTPPVRAGDFWAPGERDNEGRGAEARSSPELAQTKWPYTRH